MHLGGTTPAFEIGSWLDPNINEKDIASEELIAAFIKEDIIINF